MSVRLAFENSEASVLVIILEPWAEEYDLHPGQQIIVEFDGGSDGVPLIDHSDGRLVVYGWPGATVSVSRNGVEVSGAGFIKAPSTPGQICSSKDR